MSADTGRAVGLTGARFGRVARDTEPTARLESAPVGDAGKHPEPEPPAMPIGARFVHAPRPTTARPKPLAATTAPDPALPAREELEPDLDNATAPTVRVRPYVHTGGRTRSHTPLPIEALVCAAPGASPLRLHGSHRLVLELCLGPQSVAEVSGRLGVPLAVARVLVEDLVAQGMVTVRRGVDQASPDLELMERVLAGLRRL